MKSISLLVFAACAFAFAGCSTPTSVDSGPIEARTFSFVNRGGRPTPDYAEGRLPVHSMVQGDITKNLAAKGITKVDSGGDLTVGYLIIVGNNVSTTTIDDYFGYGDDATALHDKAQSAYSSSKNPNYFEAGTLVIDIHDSKTFKLLKRGYATRPLLRNVSNEVRAERLQEVVDEILSDVRVKQ